MESMTRLETFCNLGYHKDPLNGNLFETGDMSRTRRILTMAISSRAMVSIVGERGCGKSEAVKAALKKIDGARQPLKVVWVKKEGQERLTIDHIRDLMILNLSNETVKKGIASSLQLRRIIGGASRQQQIVVVIEEAQRLFPATLRSLKTLREIEWMNESELFTIILVAQSDPMNKPGVSEVKLRSDIVRMQGLSTHEAAHYVRETIGRHFEPEAIDLVAELPQARNYLELQAICVEVINIARAAGRERVGREDVQVIQPVAAAPIPRREVADAKPVQVSGKSALAAVLERRNPSSAREGEVLSGVINA